MEIFASGLTSASPQTSVSELSYPSANSVYDQDLYQQYNYPGEPLPSYQMFHTPNSSD